jgi:hypothetical protein
MKSFSRTTKWFQVTIISYLVATISLQTFLVVRFHLLLRCICLCILFVIVLICFIICYVKRAAPVYAMEFASSKSNDITKNLEAGTISADVDKIISDNVVVMFSKTTCPFCFGKNKC